MKLVFDQRVLQALYAGGVDNWEWYEESVSHLFPDDEEVEENNNG